MKKVISLVLGLLALFIFTGCVSGPEMYDLPAKYPAEFRPWLDEDDEVVDYVSFAQQIDPAAYSELVVLPINQDMVSFDSVDRDENEERDEDSDEIAISYLSAIDDLYWTHLSTLNDVTSVPLSKADSAPSGNVILLETDALVVNPGSRGLRYAIGFGAGATELKLQARLVDGETGDVLVEFEHASLGWGGSWGGDSYELLESNMESIATEAFGSLIYSLLGSL